MTLSSPALVVRSAVHSEFRCVSLGTSEQSKAYHYIHICCLNNQGSHLSGNSVEVFPQHPPHVLPGMGRHLMLEQEGKLAALSNAVEMAVHLVILATCRHQTDANVVR